MNDFEFRVYAVKTKPKKESMRRTMMTMLAVATMMTAASAQETKLIDTNGTIVTNNAPRPSMASNVREAILKILDNK